MAKDLTFSKYQEAIFKFIKDGKGNAVVNAVAGAGKTFTITHALSLIPKSKSVLFIAFNRHIKEELEMKVKKLGLSNVEVMTVHSYGAKALWFNYKSKLNNDKVYNVIKTLFPSWGIHEDIVAGYIGRVQRLVELAKLTLADDITSLTEIAYQHQIEIQNGEVNHALEVKDLTDRNTRVHDFNDMLYFPVRHKLRTKKFDWVFVDECQDLSSCAQELMKRAVAPGGRFVAVGDPRQCIYGFAGADVESFNKLKSIPNTVELPLSLTYRCAKNIVRQAQTIVPHIEALPNADEGKVEFSGKISDIQDSDLILSRVNRPLVTLCLKFLGEGRKSYIKGRDIGANLANMLKKTGKKNIDEALDALEVQRHRMINKLVSRGMGKSEAEESSMIKNYDDKTSAIEILAGDFITTKQVINKIFEIFSDESDGICLSSVHKAKGLEADRVFIVEPQMMPVPWAKQDWEIEQEDNIRYVAYTRAKKELMIIPQSEFTTYKIKE